MAYDKIIPIKSRLDHCVGYILDPEKADMNRILEYIGNGSKTMTQDGEAVLQTAINCQLETAYQEMQETKQRWRKTGGVLGYHLVHSYTPGEVTPEQAHDLGVEFAQQLLHGRYEAVVATHIDHEHIHNHILFNSVSLLDGRKYRDNFKAYYGDIRGASNAVSRKHGLSVIEPEGKGKSYAEWDAHQKGKATIRGIIRQDIDAIIGQSFTYASFLSALKKCGYEVKAGTNVKHTAVKPPGSSRFIRLDSLGEGYTEEEIKRRLAQSRAGNVPTSLACTPSSPAKRYVLRRGTIPKKKQKLRGFRALYAHYMFFLGFWKPGPKRKYVPFSVRKDVTQLHRYQRQFQLMQEYRIETDADLAMLRDALQTEIDVLADRRKALYKISRQQDVSGDIAEINDTLRQLRRKLKTCDQIEADIPHIREQVQTIQVQEQNTKERKNEKSEGGLTHGCKR